MSKPETTGCPYCAAGAIFSTEMPSYHVTEFWEGHEREQILCRGKLPTQQSPTLIRALERIRDMSVPDQPASSGDDETVWVLKHVSALRRIAQEALSAPALRVRGVGRVTDEPRALLVLLTDVPTDNQLREMHDYMREWNRDWEDVSNG